MGIIERRKAILLNEPHLETVRSGNTADSAHIAAFKTDMKVPLKSLKVYFSPIQEGSGDPSPDNVRPISGHTGLTIKKAGVNLLECDTFANGSQRGIVYTGVRNSDNQIESITMKGTGNSENNGFRNLNYIINKLNLFDGRFAFNAYSRQANIQPVSNEMIFAEDGTTMKTHTYAGWYIYDIDQSTYTVSQARIQAFPWDIINVQFDTTVYPMMCLAQDQGCEFEPYKGIEIPVSWQNEAGTVYGGYVDLASGELVQEWVNLSSYNGEVLPNEWMSSNDVYTPGATPTTGAQVAYKLAIPIVHQLTPQQIKAFIGRNNIWSDAGDVEVQYWKH